MVREAKREVATLEAGLDAAESAELQEGIESDLRQAKSKLRNRQKRLREYCQEHGLYNDYSRTYTAGYNGRRTSSGTKINTTNALKPLAKSGESGIIKEKVDVESNRSKYLYNSLSREERKEIIAKGQSTDKPVFSYDTRNNKAMSYLQKVPHEEGMYDICAHGSPNSIEFFKQDYPSDDKRARIDAYTLSCIVKGRKDYQDFLIECKKKGLTPGIRLFSCSTGREVNGNKCFAELLAEELGVTVHAPTKKLYVYSNGNYYVGKKRDGRIKVFNP